MSRNGKITSVLKSIKENLLEAEEKRRNNDIGQFYKDSYKINNVQDGMAIIITQDKECRAKAIDRVTHEQICQDILDDMDVEHINLSQINGDFGEAISSKYGFIFIRLSSIYNVTIVYCPEVCNEYQIKKLKEFNEAVKKFNAGSKKKIAFVWSGQDSDFTNDLDEMIEKLEKGSNKTRI